MLVFWPDELDVGKDRCGWLYGWRDDGVVVVAGLVPCQAMNDTSFYEKLCASLSSALRGNDAHPSEQPTVLGYLSFDQHRGLLLSKGSPTEPEEIDENFALSTIILFRRPDARLMRFFTLQALELEAYTRFGSSPMLSSASAATKDEIESLLPREVLVFGSCDIDSLLWKINTSSEINQIVNTKTGKVAGPLCSSSRIPKERPNRPSSQQTEARSSLRMLWSLLKSSSSTAQQLDLRYKQLCMLVTIPLFQRLNQSSFDPEMTVQYIDYTNSMWLILNDIIIGYTFSRFLAVNYLVLGRIIPQVSQDITVSWMLETLQWLNQWPLGLKLNTELSSFLCISLSGLVTLWSSLYVFITPHFANMVFAISVAGYGGMTVTFALASDLLVLATLHAYLAYYIMNAIYARLLSTLNSLWNLFRGKRHNVLRNRLDSWDYDIDELFLGTILFTLVVFLLPTFATYYSLFALTRLSTLLVLALIDLMLAFLNHFPLGALMLRIKNSDRLPGGIYLVPESSRDWPRSCFRLKNKPIGLRRIFHNHISLWSRLGSHYNPLRLLGRLLSGKHLGQMSRSEMQYDTGKHDE